MNAHNWPTTKVFRRFQSIYLQTPNAVAVVDQGNGAGRFCGIVGSHAADPGGCGCEREAENLATLPARDNPLCRSFCARTARLR